MSCQANAALVKGQSMKLYYVTIVIGGYNRSVPNTSINEVAVTKPWSFLTSKQARRLREQEKTIIDLWRELALAYDHTANLKAENSSCIKCNCLSIHWTEVEAKLQRKIKSHCCSEDPDLNLKLSKESGALSVSDLSGVAQLKKKEDVKPIISNKKCKKVLILGSSHNTGLCKHLDSVLGDEYMVTNILKPNATLDNVVGELKGSDHVITVGGSGNSLDSDLNYRTEIDTDNIAENSIHTNTGFVGHPECHNNLTRASG
jgi:hypothetical protein